MLLRQAPMRAVANVALVGGAAVDAFVSGRNRARRVHDPLNGAARLGG
jgi:hypothetical protein